MTNSKILNGLINIVNYNYCEHRQIMSFFEIEIDSDCLDIFFPTITCWLLKTWWFVSLYFWKEASTNLSNGVRDPLLFFSEALHIVSAWCKYCFVRGDVVVTIQRNGEPAEQSRLACAMVEQPGKELHSLRRCRVFIHSGPRPSIIRL